ncbi:MAG: 6-phosphogluconolactonase, partial [Xanthobacteraceae bacterium]|nr:6-phosphogluconolactonase [Xanthobacteraceae bacterium]
HFMALPTKAAEQSAFLYEEELKRYYDADELDPARPLFDLVLMGLGEDGHTASLFPGSPALDERKRWVTSVENAGQPPFVSRVTLTFPALESTREMLFLVSGTAKRSALARVLAGEDLPAARARPIGRLRWLTDRAAAPEHAS